MTAWKSWVRRGYLFTPLNEFLVRHTNRRADAWGGEYSQRMRLPVEIVARTRAAVGADFIIIYRLSMIDLIPDGSRWDEIVQLGKAVVTAGRTSSIRASAGMRHGRQPSRPVCRVRRSHR